METTFTVSLSSPRAKYVIMGQALVLRALKRKPEKQTNMKVYAK